MSQTERPLAVITGASTGLGRSYAQQLAAQGHDLLVVARRADLLNELKTEIEAKHPVQVEVFVADLADEMQLLQLVERVRQLPRIDYLINNAGFGLHKRFPDVVIEEEIAMIRVHCEANVRLCHAVLGSMCRRKSGNIIHVASLASFLSGPGAAEYCGTKAFLRYFSLSLQHDVRQYGVRVQALCPGFVHTNFHAAETMKGHNMDALPGILWLNCDRVVRDSLRAIQKKRHRVVVIPSLRYKMIYALYHTPVVSQIASAIIVALFKR
ncbi:MAG: SDR family oxidoreductase [Planctomycetaceae bacterium]|nr:SDR family oxidoreductase [Planctomycetaceae bacterium]